jgi:hypothetical protein
VDGLVRIGEAVDESVEVLPGVGYVDATHSVDLLCTE